MARGERTFTMRFVGDARQALAEMDKLVPGLRNMSSAGKAAVGSAAVAGAAIGAASSAVLVKAINLAADYEKAIDAVGAVSGASEEETRLLYETGRRLGKTTAFTATEAARAMELLAAGGVSVRDIIGGAADATVALAAAGGVDLALAADTAATAMSVWSLRTEQMNDVVNRLAAGDLVSRFGVEDLSYAIAQGGGAARTAGVEFGDFLTTVAAIAPAFASGSDAGTSLKTMFGRLNPDTKAAKEAMAELGLWTSRTGSKFFDARGNIKSMAEITDLLHNATKDLTEQQRAQALETIFGTDALRAAGALSLLTGEQFRDLDKAMAGTDAAVVAAQRQENLRGSLEKLRGSMEDIGITLGEKVLPPLTKVADLVAEWLPKIPGWAIVAAVGLGLLVGALSALGLALVPILTVAPLVAAAIGGISFAALAIPAAIAAIIAAIIGLFMYWDQIVAKSVEVREAILSTTGLQDNRQARAGLTGVGQGLVTGIPILGGIQAIKKTIPGLLGFASGGLVPGPRGAAQLAVVHGGERVLTPGQHGAGTVIINVHGNTMQSDAEMQRLVLSALTTAQQRGALGIV